MQNKGPLNLLNQPDEDECEKKTSSCHVNATCINTIGSYTCKCFTGLKGDGRSFCSGTKNIYCVLAV